MQFDYCPKSGLPSGNLFTIHLRSRLKLSRGGREEVALVCVEHDRNVPVRLKGHNVVRELGGGALHSCRRLALLPYIWPVVDLDCLFKVPVPNPPLVGFS
jgi:hypothetical protein